MRYRLPAVCLLAAHLSGAACALAFAAGAPPPLAPVTVPSIHHPDGETPQWWFRAGAAAALERGAGQARARNLILFIGDGMSQPTVAAARILKGQREGSSGEETLLSFERFAYTALSRTYNTNAQTPDSAGTATAMTTGIKTRMGVLGISQLPERGDCKAARDAALPTLLELAEDAGLATGVVTTTRITHATPASMYAHTPERNWEADSQRSDAARREGCPDIARQLVDFQRGNGIEVVLGGGRQMFLPKSVRDPEYADQNGLRADGQDLVAAWQQRHPDGRWVWNAQQLAALEAPAGPVQVPVLGLFEPSHMRYEHERPQDGAGEPSLAQMTRFAVARLQQASAAGPGFVLMVEGGRIDHAHHAGNAYRALDETIAFADAVQAAVDATAAAGDTLIVVTADHAHVMSFVGYPQRGNPILGLAVGTEEDGGQPKPLLDLMGRPYATLSYANGPGYLGASDAQPEGPKRYPHSPKSVKPSAQQRPEESRYAVDDPDRLQEAAVPLSSETHGGDDVAVYASGPGSAAFRGAIEQNVIFHLMAQAQPQLVAALCRHGACDAQGRPVNLPRP